MNLAVKHLKGFGALRHSVGYLALRNSVCGPSAVSQDFGGKLDARDSMTALFNELVLQVLRKLHVTEHLRYLVHRVNTAFDFQFLKHLFLGFL